MPDTLTLIAWLQDARRLLSQSVPPTTSDILQARALMNSALVEMERTAERAHTGGNKTPRPDDDPDLHTLTPDGKRKDRSAASYAPPAAAAAGVGAVNLNVELSGGLLDALNLQGLARELQEAHLQTARANQRLVELAAERDKALDAQRALANEEREARSRLDQAIYGEQYRP